MRIVHSWTTRRANGHIESLLGGWHDFRQTLWAWTVSALSAKKAYGNIHLVTDTLGARTLVDFLQLPYDSVSTELDQLSQPPELWAFGKVIAYGLQTEPFLHLDADAFLFQKLPQRINDAPVVAQCLESMEFSGSTYLPKMALMQQCLAELPRNWRLERIASFNCGIFGGNDIQAIQRYVADVRRLVLSPRNAAGWQECLRHIDGCHYNPTIEQMTLWLSMQEQDKRVELLAPPGENVHQALTQLRFVHDPAAKYKSGCSDGGFHDRIERIMQALYPQYYLRIESRYGTNSLAEIFRRWPSLASLVSTFRSPQDRGVGDTIARNLDHFGVRNLSEAWSRLTGRSLCRNCAKGQADLNGLYPYQAH